MGLSLFSSKFKTKFLSFEGYNFEHSLFDLKQINKDSWYWRVYHYFWQEYHLAKPIRPSFLYQEMRMLFLKHSDGVKNGTLPYRGKTL